MRYRDASALVPKPDSDSARAWLSEDAHVVAWAWTRTEIVGAIERRIREGLWPPRRYEALERLDAFAASTFSRSPSQAAPRCP